MEYQISVRRLVEFIYRHGDIDNRKTSVTEDAMLEGSRIHRMLQRQYQATSDYESEVALKMCIDTGRYSIVLDGRADGILHEEGKVTIDEIKGTYKKLDHIEEPQIEHLAQAKCYAYTYAHDNGLSEISVRVTYCNFESLDVKLFEYNFTWEEIEVWFLTLVDEYQKWTDYEYDWAIVRNLSISKLEFPFDYRDGQKNLVASVYRTIEAKKKLFIQAPTGSGKTIAAIYPAVRAVGECLADKIFYLTAKTITRTVAEDTYELLRNQGLAFKSVTLTAKEKICPLETCECNPKGCERAKGHNDRINEALYDIITHEQFFTREIIETYANKHMVCPFEFALDISLFSDGIICDYNYVFDPHVYLRRYFGEGNKGQYIFLVDEAHNLLDRAREMYSAELIKEDLMDVRNAVSQADPKLATALVSCNRKMGKLKKTCEDAKVIWEYDEVSKALGRVVSKLEAFLERDEHTGDELRKKVLDFYFKASHFQYIEGMRDESYRCYIENVRDPEVFRLKQLCIDPSEILKNVMLRSVSTILFSATLLPIQYYKGLLGGTSEDYEVYAKSIFDTDKRMLMVASDVTSKFTRRGVEEYTRMAAYIKEIVRGRAGNYFVFAPSFAIMNQVASIYENDFVNHLTEEVMVQSEKMNELEREEFLARFFDDEARAESEGSINVNDLSEAKPEEHDIYIGKYKNSMSKYKKTLIGFGVLGGIFSEGIDLKGDSLIGAIIIGNGMPGISFERNIMKDFFDEEGYNGFDYAYKIPGMNKVEQAAGRVIRTTEDVGVIALLEERFLEGGYKRLFPREWNDREIVNIANVGMLVESFWEDEC